MADQQQDIDEPPDQPTSEPGADSPFRGSYVPRIIAIFPHDPSAFTQGLELFGPNLIESVGLTGQSDRRIVDIETGTLIEQTALDDEFFGEGLTAVGDELIQLTWQNGVYTRSKADTLTEIGRGTYEGEGWGICFDGSQLVMSNGSSSLAFRNPDTFELDREVTVSRTDGSAVELLNELECVNGQVFANIYTEDEIVVIDPATGVVVASIDGSSLRPADAPADDAQFVLNGIAFDAATGHFYLTGKWWSVLYEVELVSS